MKCLFIWFHDYELIKEEVQTFLDSADEVFMYTCKSCGKIKIKRNTLWMR